MELRIRKIIQISDSSGGLHALCNDGTVWGWYHDKWWQREDVPQPVSVVHPPASLMTFRQVLNDVKTRRETHEE